MQVKIWAQDAAETGFYFLFQGCSDDFCCCFFQVCAYTSPLHTSHLSSRRILQFARACLRWYMFGCHRVFPPPPPFRSPQRFTRLCIAEVRDHTGFLYLALFSQELSCHEYIGPMLQVFCSWLLRRLRTVIYCGASIMTLSPSRNRWWRHRWGQNKQMIRNQNILINIVQMYSLSF